MRLFRIPLILAVLAAGFAQVPAQAEESPKVTFEGHGWGHGVGMSQYGALAMAEDGYSAEAIVEHYYTGANVTPLTSALSGWVVTDPAPLWINLVSRPGGVSLAAVGGNLTLCQQEPKWVGTMYQGKNAADIQPYNLLLENRLSALGFDPGTIDGNFDGDTDAAVRAFQTSKALVADGLVGANTKNALWGFDSSDRCVVSNPIIATPKTFTPSAGGADCTLAGATIAGDCYGRVKGLTATKRVRVMEKTVRNGTPIEVAHGTLRIRPDLSGGSGSFEGIHVLVELGVDDYVKGIDEMPVSWPEQALRAQAIASRSYGLANAVYKGPESAFSGALRDSCWCHLWSSTYSQVFAGFYPETILGGRWSSAAQATAGQVLRHPTAGLVNAFFSSSNGGASEANEDAWGSSPVAYLRSVDDPWSLDSSNPNADWSKAVALEALAGLVGMDELTGIAVVETNQSGSARTVRFVGLSDGIEVSQDRTGAWVRSKLGLRSNYYDVTWGDATTPPAPPPAPEPEPEPLETFSDVTGNTFQADIEWAYASGVTRGCNPPDNTLFCPGQRVTRGQMAAFLARFLNLPASSNDFFSDDDGSTFEADINKLAEAGITKGCRTDRFCPNDRVSREQMAAFIVRTLGLKDDSHEGFSDVSTSNTFYEDIKKLATAGITKGCNPPTNSKYCPAESVTRAQMTAFLHRASKIDPPQG